MFMTYSSGPKYSKNNCIICFLSPITKFIIIVRYNIYFYRQKLDKYIPSSRYEKQNALNFQIIHFCVLHRIKEMFACLNFCFFSTCVNLKMFQWYESVDKHLKICIAHSYLLSLWSMNHNSKRNRERLHQDYPFFG